jgi:DNA-binding XRE family transcriptional regulator
MSAVESMQWEVYALCDPTSADSIKRVRYIGVTTRGVATRLHEHLVDAHAKKNGHKRSWIRSLLNLELAPVAEVLDRGFGDELQNESKWIAMYRTMGANLTNVSEVRRCHRPRLRMRLLVEEERKRRGWTQAQLAEACGISQGQVSQVEGRGSCSLATLERLARGLGVEPAALLVSDVAVAPSSDDDPSAGPGPGEVTT